MDRTLILPRVAADRTCPADRCLIALPAALVSGLLMAACYDPLNLHMLAWIAPVPFLLVLPRLGRDQAWLYGLLVGLGYYGIALAWLYQLNHLIGGLFIFQFALLMGFSFRVARVLIDRFGLAAMLWAVPLCFTGQEVLRSEGHDRFRFAFGAWGYSQAHNLWVAQIASIGGAYFVSFVLMLVSSALAYALLRRGLRGWAAAGAVAAGVCVLAAASQPRLYNNDKRVPVACIQGEDLGFKQYADLVERALQPLERIDPAAPAFVVLPEHSLYGLFVSDDPAIDLLAGIAVRHGAYICAAGDTQFGTGLACPFDNVAWLIDPTGRIVLRQLKAVPIPYFRDGNPARTQAVAATPAGAVGVFICYDGTFTDVPRRLVDLGAEMLLCPVMDVADWPDQQRRQHADVAIFRAIELRRCIVRAASSGISQIIEPDGRIQAIRTKDQGPGVLAGCVWFTADRTAFVRGGYLFAPIVATTFIALAVVLTGAGLAAKALAAGRRLRAREPVGSITGDPLALLA